MRLLASLALATAAFLALALAPSAAAAPYRYEAAQSAALSAGVPGGAFEDPRSATFDAAGNLYLVDSRGHAGKAIIDKFDAEGIFQAQLGSTAFTEEFAYSVAVNNETGHLYAGEAGFAEPSFSDLLALNGSGEKLSQWNGENTPAKNFGAGCCNLSTAVDNSSSPSHGDVYVATPQGGGRIDVFEPQNGDLEEGKFLRELVAPEGGFGLGSQVGLAVNQSNGDLYVAAAEAKVVDQYSPTGELKGQITGPSPANGFKHPQAVAVDSTDGHVFIIDHRKGSGDPADNLETVDEFDSAGVLVNQVTEVAPNELFEEPTGLAVQQHGPHAGELYVVDRHHKTVDVFAEEDPGPPLIAAEGVQDLIGSQATFLGEVNPKGSPTEYRFEYGSCSSSTTCATSPYGSSVPVPDASIPGQGFSALATSKFTVSGLLSATTYHFRLVAHNANGTVPGEERIFSTQGPAIASQLPDDRQWELVSPPDKHGGNVLSGGEQGLIQAAADGSAVTYLASAPTEGSPPGYVAGGQVLSTRAASGWSSRELGTAHSKPVGAPAGLAPPYRLFNEDLSAAVIQPYGLFNPTLSSAGSEQTPYRQALGSCSASCFTPLVSGKEGFADVPPGTEFGEELFCEENNGLGAALPVCGPLIESGTRDGNHLVLRSEGAALVTGAPAHSLYEWSSGQLSLVSILPPNEAGKELPLPTNGNGELWPRLGTRFGLGGGSARRAISADGSRIFWSDGTNLYMRDMVKGKSIQIDAPEAGCPLGEGEGQCRGGGGIFQIAAADGSRVYFTDERRLTADAGAARVESGPRRDLYECRIVEGPMGDPACDLKDLTPIEGKQSADVQGEVLGASADGSTLYFVANGVLSGAGNQRGTCHADTGASQSEAHCSLYLLKAGAAPQFVASLSGEDLTLWNETARQPTRTSPDGRWLAFMSGAPQTGYDNIDAVSGKPDAEVYLYDASGAGSLTCASCEPSGARPTGVDYRKLENGESSVLETVREQWRGWVAALLPEPLKSVSSTFAYQPRYLSNSGRLYFNSLDALVPQDSNGTGDVYQYEPAGIGSCTTTSSTYLPQSGGCVDLISSGTSPERSYFLDASQSGDDVFFFTLSRLTSQDVDQRVDVYDAHVCSGAVPCFPGAPPAPPACEGDACQQPAVPPPHPTPGTSLLNGPTDVLECPKGKVKKGEKCVKHKSRKKHHKKHGHKKQKRANPEAGGPK